MYSSYKEELLKRLKRKDTYVYSVCFDKLNELHKSVQDWTDDDLDKILVSMESISANSIRKYVATIRDIQNFISAKEGLDPQRLKPTKPIFSYISYPKLRSRILTYEDYKIIRKNLTFITEGEEYNFRDKILFELAWEGLANSEIRYLKESDIQWIKDEQAEIKQAKLKLKDGREIIIDDFEVVNDLIAVMNERLYARVDKNGKILLYPYRYSPYLIKPIAITAKIKNTKDESVSNPSLMLRQILSKTKLVDKIISQDVKGDQHKIDLVSLNLEDIRRSKIIYMLAINKYLSVADIANLFGKSVECDFYWLKEVAQKIYY